MKKINNTYFVNKDDSSNRVMPKERIYLETISRFNEEFLRKELNEIFKELLNDEFDCRRLYTSLTYSTHAKHGPRNLSMVNVPLNIIIDTISGNFEIPNYDSLEKSISKQDYHSHDYLLMINGKRSLLSEDFYFNRSIGGGRSIVKATVDIICGLGNYEDTSCNVLMNKIEFPTSNGRIIYKGDDWWQ